MPFAPRTADFSDDFVKRFTDLFPPSDPQYASVHRRLKDGLIDEVARFLHSKNVKFTARQIRDARQADGTHTPEFNDQVNRGCAIDDLYKETTQMLRSVT